MTTLKLIAVNIRLEAAIAVLHVAHALTRFSDWLCDRSDDLAQIDELE